MLSEREYRVLKVIQQLSETKEKFIFEDLVHHPRLRGISEKHIAKICLSFRERGYLASNNEKRKEEDRKMKERLIEKIETAMEKVVDEAIASDGTAPSGYVNMLSALVYALQAIKGG